MSTSDKYENYRHSINSLLIYQTLKKHSLLNELNSKGIDTTDIYNPNAAGFTTAPCVTVIEEKLTKISLNYFYINLIKWNQHSPFLLSYQCCCLMYPRFDLYMKMHLFQHSLIRK